MIRIPCPHCGPRDHAEFSYGGDAGVAYPPLDAETPEWFAAVHLRANPRGHRDGSRNIRMRKVLDLYANVVPFKAESGVDCYHPDLDVVVFRQNTEGLYAGVEYHPLPQDVGDKLTQTHPAQMGKMDGVDSADIAISSSKLLASVQRISLL